MSLEFGLIITLVGIACVFSVLMLVAVACWVLKKIFKGERADGNDGTT